MKEMDWWPWKYQRALVDKRSKQDFHPIPNDFLIWMTSIFKNLHILYLHVWRKHGVLSVTSTVGTNSWKLNYLLVPSPGYQAFSNDFNNFFSKDSVRSRDNVVCQVINIPHLPRQWSSMDRLALIYTSGAFLFAVTPFISLLLYIISF